MKHCPIPKSTLTPLPTQTFHTLVHRFCQLHPLPQTRGRPRQYSEALIFTLALLRTRDHASLRPRLYALAHETLPTHALPTLGMLVYRFHYIPDTRWHQLLVWLARQGIALEHPTTQSHFHRLMRLEHFVPRGGGGVAPSLHEPPIK